MRANDRRRKDGVLVLACGSTSISLYSCTSTYCSCTSTSLYLYLSLLLLYFKLGFFYVYFTLSLSLGLYIVVSYNCICLCLHLCVHYTGLSATPVTSSQPEAGQAGLPLNLFIPTCQPRFPMMAMVVMMVVVAFQCLMYILQIYHI